MAVGSLVVGGPVAAVPVVVDSAAAVSEVVALVADVTEVGRRVVAASVAAAEAQKAANEETEARVAVSPAVLAEVRGANPAQAEEKLVAQKVALTEVDAKAAVTWVAGLAEASLAAAVAAVCRAPNRLRRARFDRRTGLSQQTSLRMKLQYSHSRDERRIARPYSPGRP